MLESFSSANGLFSFRPIETESAHHLNNWMIESQIPHPVPVSELHCTIVNSPASVPTYVPASGLITIQPSEFQVELLNNALVIGFQNTFLQEQHNYALNLGASSDFASFRPHVSVSYHIPLSFSLEDLKPPTMPIVLGPESSRNQDLEWLANQGRRNHEVMKYVLDPLTIDGFLEFLGMRGVLFEYGKLPINHIKPSQPIHESCVQAMNHKPRRYLMKPYILSADYQLFDGESHLRWQTLKNNYEGTVPVCVTNISLQRMLQLFGEYEGS